MAKDVRDAGLHLLVDLDKAAFADLDAHFFEAQILSNRDVNSIATKACSASRVVSFLFRRDLDLSRQYRWLRLI